MPDKPQVRSPRKLSREVPRDHFMAIVKSVRADFEGIIPAVPKVARAKMLGLPGQVCFFHFGDLKSAVAEKLYISVCN